MHLKVAHISKIRLFPFMIIIWHSQCFYNYFLYDRLKVCGFILKK